jgi:hypothetical protein
MDQDALIERTVHFNPLSISLEGVARFETQRFENLYQRTESRETGLQQVGTDKSGEPQPIDAVNLRQKQGNQDHGSGKSENHAINVHIKPPEAGLTIGCCGL